MNKQCFLDLIYRCHIQFLHRFSLQILSTTPKDFSSTNAQPSGAGTKDSSNIDITGDNSTEGGYINETLTPTATLKSNTSLFPGSPTDHIVVDVANVHNQKKKGNGNWLFILIVTASSFVIFAALVFVVLVLRHKRKNGVWFKGVLINVPFSLRNENYKYLKVVIHL